MLSIKEVRSIIRKRIIESMILESHTFSRGNFAKMRGIDGQKLLKKDDSTGQIVDAYFIPKGWPDDSSKKPMKQNRSNRVYETLTDQNELDQLKLELGGVDNQELNDAISNISNMSSEMTNLLAMSAEDIMTLCFKSDTNEINKIAKILISDEKIFRPVNAIFKRKKGDSFKPVGFIFKGNDKNIDRSTHDHAELIKTEFNSKVSNAFMSMFSKGAIDTFVNLLKKAKDAGYTYWDFAELSRMLAIHGLGPSKGKNLYDAINMINRSGLRSNINTLPSYFNNQLSFLVGNAINEIPLFNYVKKDGTRIPVYVGDYEEKRQALADALTQIMNPSDPDDPDSSSQPVRGSTTQAQSQSQSQSQSSSGVRMARSGSSRGDGVRGIKMKTEARSGESINTLDDLGFKAGTDRELQVAISDLVKNERKFKGTGIINLEVLLNKRGKFSGVKFRKGQNKFAARQIEMLKSKIKEFLRNAQYAPINDPGSGTATPTDSEQWYGYSKDKLLPRGKNYRRGAKFYINLEIY